jgi:hypothetical protein
VLSEQETAEAETYFARLDQEWRASVRPGEALSEPAAKQPRLASELAPGDAGL